MATAPLEALLVAASSVGADAWTPATGGPSLTTTLAALTVAGAALYLPGLALVHVLPSPRLLPLELRVAVAPALSVVVAAFGVRVLGLLGLGLHARQLLIVTLVLGALGWWRTRAEAPPQAARAGGRWDLVGLVALIGLGAVLWLASLWSVGLVLPNRDFKNHALFVAQIAATGSTDPEVVLQASPIGGAPTGEFYPLGLHALLAWALPDPAGSTVGITAAAAVVVTIVSLPLAVRTLARMWCPDDARLPWLAGLCAVCLPGATAAAFAIGSVVLLAGVALFGASLCCLWLVARGPHPSAMALLVLSGLGLFLLHVAEAVGLLLVACGLPLLSEGRRALREHARVLAIAGGIGVGLLAIVIVLLRSELADLLRLQDSAWDLQPNDEGPVRALLESLVQQPVPVSVLSLVWWGVAMVGLLVGLSRGWSSFPAWVLTVSVMLGALATLRLPAAVTAVTAPWYGTATRVMLLAFPMLVVAAAAGALAAVDRARFPPLRWAILAAGCLLILASTASLVPDRRADLAASVAGAGNTPAIGDWLREELRPGGTVLNLEADGTPLLFADARVPVLSGASQALVDAPVDGVPLAQRFLDLSDPDVARRLAALDVRFIALGTASRYWGQGVGYDWRQVAAQPQVELVAAGDQVVVLAYRQGAR